MIIGGYVIIKCLLTLFKGWDWSEVLRPPKPRD